MQIKYIRFRTENLQNYRIALSLVFLWGFLLLAYKTFSLLEAKNYDCDQSSLNEYEHYLHFS